MSDNFYLHEGVSPLILSFPHSGTALPDSITKTLTTEGQELADTDWHVPRLYDFAKAMDVTWLEARFSRYIIDLNRDPSGVSLYPGQKTTELCPLDTFNGAPLWLDGCAPDEQEIALRKQLYFAPYHAVLKAQIARVKAHHGFAVLYDCHSIHGTIPRLFEGDLPVLNLGTDQGRSCAGELQGVIGNIMQNSPYAQIINGRFRGGWITRHYGRPGRDVHAVQMEIAQHAYMDETPPWHWQEKRAAALQKMLEEILNAVLEWSDTQG